MNERCISCWISTGSVRSCSPEVGPVTTCTLRISRNRHTDGGHIHMWMVTVHNCAASILRGPGRVLARFAERCGAVLSRCDGDLVSDTSVSHGLHRSRNRTSLAFLVMNARR